MSNNDQDGKFLSFSANIPITVPSSPPATGPGHPNVFASEFGCVVMSSFESMSATLSPQHWSVHGGSQADDCQHGDRGACPIRQCEARAKAHNPMSYRNYPCDSIILTYFRSSQTDLDAVGRKAFQGQLWRCMMGQALEMKSNIETRRAGNTFGITVWQYNEIWPTGGWGSVEYGCESCEGQVVGGRWKPLQYLYRQSVLTDVIVACGLADNEWRCYVKNDRAAQGYSGAVTINAVRLSDGHTTELWSDEVALGPGPGAMSWVHMPALAALNASESVVTAVAREGNATVCSNVVLLAPPRQLSLPKATVQVQFRHPTDPLSITVVSDELALFVTLTTQAAGRFSDNAFLMPRGEVEITFIPFVAATAELKAQLKATLRVEHTALYRD